MLPGQLRQPAQQLPLPPERHQVRHGPCLRGPSLRFPGADIVAHLAPVEGPTRPGRGGEKGEQALAPSGGRCATDGDASPCALSIALDPLYPSRCSWETFGYATSTSMAQASDGLSPLQLSGQLNSLPCSLAFRQEETISVIRLIEQVGLGRGWERGAGLLEVGG